MVIQEYQDPKIKKYLRYGYWYQDNKEKIRQIIVGILLTLVALVWLVFLFNAFRYWQSSSSNAGLVESIAFSHNNYPQINIKIAPQEPKFGAVEGLASGDNLVDFAVLAEN